MWRCTFVLPLWKGDGSSMTNNYWPISKLCVVPKILERLVNNQLKIVDWIKIVFYLLSGFRKLHSTVTASLKVLSEALDAKIYSAALFI